MAKPLGVIVFGILEIVFSSINLLSSINFITSFHTFFFNDLTMVVLFIIPVMIGISRLVGGISALMLKSWARKLIVINSIAQILSSIIAGAVLYLRAWSVKGNTVSIWDFFGSIFTSKISFVILITFVIGVIGIAYNILLIWYFSKKETKAAFQMIPVKK